MLQVKLPVVDRIHPQSNKFATGVENKATGDSKHNDSPGALKSCLKIIQQCICDFAAKCTRFHSCKIYWP